MSWKRVKIGSFLKRVKQQIEIKDTVEYKRITIKTKHQGVFLRDEIKGSLIGTKLQFVVTEGQFILSKIDARLGAFGIVPEELDGAIITGNFWVFEVDETQINIEWFNLFTSSGNFYDICNQASSGTTHRKYLDEDKFLNFEIDLPELYEQDAFMNKYQSYYISYKSILREIDQQQTYLQLLRQTILQEAVQGKLTKQDPTDEPATKLLKRIKAEKEKLIKAGKLKKEKELPPITEDEIPFELPEGWVWCRLGEVALFSEAGKSFQCSERPIQRDEWGIIKMSAISSGNFRESENKFFKEVFKEEQAHKIQEGDLLFARASGSKNLTGISCIVKSIKTNLLLNDKTIRFRFPKDLEVEYVNHWNNCSFGRTYYDTIMGSKTTTMNNITREQFNNLITPLPPLTEQQRIVAKVQQLQQQLSQLEAQVQLSRQYAQQLLQSVLKEAFEEKKKEYATNEQLTMAAED
jgi:type I restriction enzyme, S subunit